MKIDVLPIWIVYYSLTFRVLALRQRGPSDEGPTLETLDYTREYTNLKESSSGLLRYMKWKKGTKMPTLTSSALPFWKYKPQYDPK